MTETTPQRTPAIIGFLVAGAVILGVSFFVSTREAGSDVYDDVPPLTILSPSSGDSVANPLTIVFRTPGSLEFDAAMGWMAGDLHLHAMAGEQEIMPAAADIVPRDSVFTWRLPRLGAGTHRIYLTWAGRHHGNLRGQADTVIVHIAE